jgi:alanine racemase
VTLAILAGPPERGTGMMLEHGLTPVLNDLAQIARWRRAGPGLPAILNIDTGMSRLGLSASDLERIAADPTLLEGINPILVMSHLACADEPSHPRNTFQKERFVALASLLPAAPRSLAASSGIFLGADYHHQMVRPGAALYGLNPTPGLPNPMAQVIELKAKVIQLQEIDANTGVGYGATRFVDRASRVAILGLGYADGYLRAGSNIASLRFGAHKIPVIGRISMDLVTVDVTDIPVAEIRPGTWVDLLGPEYGVDDLARDCGTIGYEVLTRLSQRLHRVYLS